MITSLKEFGSYKLVKVGQYDDVETKEQVSSCSILDVWTEVKLLSIRKYNHDTRYVTVYEYKAVESDR